VKLRLGYKDNLTDTFLSDGELSFEPIRSGYGWCKLDLNQPVVVISKKQYWLDIASRDAMFHLGRAENGAEVAIRAMMNGVWSDYVSESKGPMLKFYGRVLPVLS
jgi:hypothetical protein